MANFVETVVYGNEEQEGLSSHQRLMRFARQPDTRTYEFLPIYEVATTRRLWHLIAPYINDTHDILSACLVSNDVRKVFTPRLWGSPARHFRQIAPSRQSKSYNFLSGFGC
jgi:hypothetical protein